MSKRSCGIVGLPNVGKSTLFKLLSGRRDVLSENYPFCTIDPSVGIGFFDDARLKVLSDLFNSKKIIRQSVTFIDIAGLVQGASNGEGLGNKFLSNIREVSSIIHVVRCFNDQNVTHVYGTVDPIRDIEIINSELILADLQNIDNILVKLKKKAKTDLIALEDVNNLLKLKTYLESGNMINSLLNSDDSLDGTIKKYQFLTSKPVMFLCNVSELDINNLDVISDIKDAIFNKFRNSDVLFISSKIELELADMPLDEKIIFLQEFGIKESINDIIHAGMKLTGTQTFFTAGVKESRAWDIKIGGTALDAAAEIHNDLADKFIRAEVISYDDMIKYGSLSNARLHGALRSEGSHYVVKDGDIITILASP